MLCGKNPVSLTDGFLSERGWNLMVCHIPNWIAGLLLPALPEIRF
jgi:hypothetical protein